MNILQVDRTKFVASFTNFELSLVHTKGRALRNKESHYHHSTLLQTVN